MKENQGKKSVIDARNISRKIDAIIGKILKSINLVKQRDAFLFLIPRAHELAIAHKLAEYLAIQF